LTPEIGKKNRWYLDLKKAVIEQQGKAVLDSLPEGEDVCLELAETVIDYLPKRYPVSHGRGGISPTELTFLIAALFS
jgi:hypothetical protein